MTAREGMGMVVTYLGHLGCSNTSPSPSLPLHNIVASNSVGVASSYQVTNTVTEAKYKKWESAPKVIFHCCKDYTYYTIGVVIKMYTCSILYVLSNPSLRF